MNDLPVVVSATGLENSFVGDVVQVCIVTRDLHRVMAGMVRLGIGPWRVYLFSPETVSDMTIDGQPADYSMKLALARSGRMGWEIVEPVSGASIYEDFLRRHGEGIHHVALDCGERSWGERVAAFEALGLPFLQGGSWGALRYAYYGTEADIATTVEIIDTPPGSVVPEPIAWYPAPPPE
jgi:methylmalonyl-CoA/ethylmalonyl-CoA epimerase